MNEPPAIHADPPRIVVVLGTLESVEREVIAATLARHHGEKKAAARALGISRSALYAKLHRLEIPHGIRRGVELQHAPEAPPAA